MHRTPKLAIYCQTIEHTADQLANVGHPISDKQLFLQTLHGLPKYYRTVVNLTSFQPSLPTFFKTRSLLQMEETRISEPEPLPTTILYTSQSLNPNPSYSSNARGGPWRGHGRGYGRGHGHSGRDSPM